MSREVPGHAHSSLNTCRPSSLSTKKPVITHKAKVLLPIRILQLLGVLQLYYLSSANVYASSLHIQKTPPHSRVSQTGLYLLTALSYPCEVKNAFSNLSHAKLSPVKSPLHGTDLDSQNGKPLPPNKRKILRFTAF